MSKITLNNVADLTSFTTAQTTINANSSTIQAAFDDTLSRDGLTPNTMGANLDMNSNRILNLPAPNSVNEPARLIDVVTNPTIVIPTSFPTRAAFFVHKDLTDQTGLINLNYNNVTWPAKAFDVGGFFDTTNNWWTPPAGYVALHTEVWQSQHAAVVSTPTFVAKIQRRHDAITITNASPGVITWPLHGLFIGQPIQMTTTGALPTGFTSGTVYYVQSTPTVNTFTLSATHGGAAINTSSAGSGVHAGFCDVAAGIGSGIVGTSGATGQAISQASAAAVYSNGTDHYLVIYFTTSNTPANDGIIDSNPAHTHFSGHWIGT